MQDWQDRFTALKNQFISRSVERIGSLALLIESLSQKPNELALLKDVRQQFHWFAGSGGIYGFESVTRLGLQGEDICDHLIRENKPATATECDQLLRFVVAMRSSIEGNASSGSAEPAAESMPQSPGRSATPSPSYFLIVEPHPIPVHSFLREFEEKGLRTEIVRSVASGHERIMTRLPDAMIISVPMPDGNAYELAELVRSLPGGERPPIVAVSQQGGFLDKVQAIRSGVDAFFEHPLDDAAVSKKLRHLLDRDKPEMYKILSVEDDPDQAAFIKLTLESAGYSVVSLQDPTKFEETFLQFEPDLVLLDVMLGAMTGFELAQYIRQQDRYAALPVVFLTTENALEMHVKSARIGGDDHLLKPIAPQLLAAAVAGRLEKARVLKKLIERDVLSGCLTHGSFMDQSSEAIAPDSHRFSMTLLLFDIDSLHVINDRFGYAAGDKVIGSIGPALHKAFRNCPLIGRISGDRFALVLENLDEMQVERLARQVIDDFCAVQHYARGSEFRATISGAFVPHQAEMDMRDWVAAAEGVLKKAKEQGGRQLFSQASVPDWYRMAR
ncbi:MAG: response regulator [Candidatus Obscuribacterales bacterium]|nr:response regulator [Candidatus Obscuribacterales bacterium]